MISTPIGHSFCGAAAYLGIRRKERWDWTLFFWVLFISNLPDIDYVPGFIAGKPNLFHHGPTHSVLFVILIGLVVGFAFSWREGGGFRKFGFLFISVGLLHLLLDYFTVDRSFPYGEQLFWPFSGAYFLSPVTVFRDVAKGSTNSDFFRTAFNPHNLITGFTELAVFVPMTLATLWISLRKSKKYDAKFENE